MFLILVAIKGIALCTVYHIRAKRIFFNNTISSALNTVGGLAAAKLILSIRSSNKEVPIASCIKVSSAVLANG